MPEFFEFQGCRLAYRIDGVGSSPPLLMIQGVGAHGTSPNPLTEILARNYLCLSFDHRGIGASQPAGQALSAGQMADDALALMNHVGWDSAHVVGHSFGGLIAMELALRARARVRSLSLLCSFARGADSTRFSTKLLWILVRLRLAPRFMRRRAFLDLVLPPGHRVDSPQELARHISKIVGHDVADVPSIARQQVKAMRASDVTARLAELSGIPTLVISAEDDMIAPAALGQSIAKGIGGAHYVGIPGAAHSFPILEPGAVRVAGTRSPGRGGASPARACPPVPMTKLVVGVWFLVALGLSLSGWFARFSAVTLFGFGALVSTTGFIVLHRYHTGFRALARTADLRRLTEAQILRFYGLLAFVEAYRRVLPAAFAIPTGIIDASVAGTAFLAATRLNPARRGFFIWHWLGVGGLAISVLLVILTSTPRFGLVDAGHTSQAMAQFPMSLVPTFIGPLVLVFHLLALTEAREKRKGAMFG